jgi:hypothetical protein
MGVCVCVSFHTFTLPEDRCARFLVKNLGRSMPESFVREELESLDIHVQGVTQLRSGRRDQDPAKDRPLTPHFIVSVARGSDVSKVRSINEHCGLRVSVETCVVKMGSLQCKRCQRFGHTQRNCGYAPRCVTCGGSHISGGCCTPREQPQSCGCGDKLTANYRGCIKWKEARRPLKMSARGCPKERRHGPLRCSESQRVGPSAEQMDMSAGWNHVVREGRVAKATTTPKHTP